jgi:hypothetical protein
MCSRDMRCLADLVFAHADLCPEATPGITCFQVVSNRMDTQNIQTFIYT